MANKGFNNLFRKWITSIDRISLFFILAIIAIGIWVSIIATPSVAMKLELSPFYFAKRHVIAVPIAVLIIFFISFLQARHIRLMSILGYVLCLLLIVGSLFWGNEIKGARRWISFLGLSFQPSEFLKPSLTILTAWLIAEQYRDRRFPGILFSFISVSLAVSLLLLQPDVGMVVVIMFTWFAQLFISGLSIFFVGLFVSLGLGSMIGLYFVFPHFADRINRFITRQGEDVDLYQIQKSIDAFKNGGFLGKGPGEGVVKTLLPDSHSDFVFSVIGEEFGFIMCVFIIGLFSAFIIRSFIRVMKSSSIFSFSAVFGIAVQIGLQVFVNICSSLNIIPTKGMTLPFISYGGSSLISSAISVGIIIALTKRNSLKQEIL
ncbi:MAG: putative lipid II flippase FtsW [Holosporales bacterium]|jgi:cell division protein FtsW|nr:putative lipid II flippase FtsW [Holosporales bacterium]